jgi:putative copper resistance protein D
VAALLNLFDFLHAILSGVTGVGAALVVGGAAFLWIALGPDHTLDRFARRSGRAIAAGGVIAAAGQVAHVGLTTLAVIDATPHWRSALLGASFFRAGVATAIAGAVAAAAGLRLARTPSRPARIAAAAAAAGIALCGAFTSHAAGWLGDRTSLLALDVAHRAAASAWLGGLAHFLLFGAARPTPVETKQVLPRASRLFGSCVAVLVACGVVLAVPYLGSPRAIVGTSYGFLLQAKVLLLGCLLGLAAFNHRTVSRVARGEAEAGPTLWSFVETEVGLGVATLFIAATLASTPPGIDVGPQTAALADVLHVFQQGWRDLAALGLGALDVEKVGVSAFNHRFSGAVLVVMASLAIADRAGLARWARNWPLALLVLGLFVMFESDRNAWPFGTISFVDTWTDPEIIQHRLAGALVIGFALFEWAVRTGRLAPTRAGLVFPAVSLLGGGLLIVHAHAGVGLKDEFLIQLTHLPIAVLGVIAGASRWLELRLPTREGRLVGWIWPPALLGVGLILLAYWEPPRAAPDPRDAAVAPHAVVAFARSWDGPATPS